MKILFFGDSITDMGRDRNDPHDMGNGYPRFVSALLQEKYPNEAFEFLNLGISGNGTPQMLKRVENDVVPHQPDIVTILVGINDVRFLLGEDQNHPLGMENFKYYYEQVLKIIKEQTNAKIIMLEPFYHSRKEETKRSHCLSKVIEVEKQLAFAYADAFVPLDGLFTSLEVLHKKEKEFSQDNVHPNDECARIIAKELVKALSNFI